MDLHAEIMNICMDEEELKRELPPSSFAAYKVGHRDARHAAAELSLKYIRYIEELEYLIEKVYSEDTIQNVKDGMGID